MTMLLLRIKAVLPRIINALKLDKQSHVTAIYILAACQLIKKKKAKVGHEKSEEMPRSYKMNNNSI